MPMLPVERGICCSPVMPLIPTQESDVQTSVMSSPSAGITNAVLIAPGNKVVYTTLSYDVTSELMELSKQGDLVSGGIWRGKDDQYVIETVSTSQGIESDTQGVTAVMAAPLSKIKAM
ncbi:hypothetical protein [Paenibacillus sp. RC67]|uniref:hypothetical protein n=1 Tax=Paenibacillus sp. RC67 TaxID=3039392 RepID=UPI0024AC90A8|nr:hypothetical protein [Paenibacillus sp. RC67]